MTSRRRIPHVFVVVAAGISLTIALTYWFGLKVIQSREEVLAHREISVHLDTLLSSLKDAETGQRGYLLTGSESYLGPYQKALDRVPPEINTIRLLSLSPEARKEMEPVPGLIQQKLEELRLTIETRKTQGLQPALAIVLTGEGKHLMDDIRARIGAVQGMEETAMQNDLARAGRLTFWRTAIFVWAGFFNLLFLLWAYRVIQREMNRYQEAVRETERQRDEVRRQKDLLNTTLTSIGDCVIVTDQKSAITFMNAVAEELTGWTAAEALGKPLDTVFRIVNEHTRESVESPVDKVLRLGAIVGLANHTLLIRRDGGEVPIDDSGSPIREPDGAIRGVVLVFRDFTQHKNWERSLEEARLAAEAANSAKDQFLAVLSHELRTPLSPILTTLGIWELNNYIPENLKEDVRMMRHNVELEARLIDDLLDLTRIAKGVLQVSLQTENIHALLESVITMSTSEIHNRRLDLKMELNAKEHFASVDAARAQQIFWNLIKNATKFTERGGSITVLTGNNGEGDIVITFSDTGIGISEETLGRLFHPFEQGEHRLTHRFGGLGLGLSITKSLTEALGGTITAASEGPGHGSTFTLKFPTVHPSTALNSLKVDWPLPAKTLGKSLRILLMEDHPHTAQAMARLLRHRGHQVSAVASVKSAKEVLSEKEFDLLLCDLGLPDGNGLDFLLETRKTCSTPAIALSGFGMEEDLAKCEQAGFFAHLTKPVDISRLEALMDQFTAGH